MSDFGTQLKQARERQGISLRQIATSTKISVVALEALERGDFSRLPGGIFSRAFVRSYAIEVGLEPDAVVEQFLVELGAAAPAEDDTPRPDVTDDDRAFLERQRKAGLYLRVALGVLAVAIVVALVAWQINRGTAREVTEVPPPEPTTSAAPSVAAPFPDESGESATGPSAAADAATAGIRIEMVATAVCYLEVTTDGQSVPPLELAQGQRHTIAAEREVTVRLGSAGAVTWTLNGRPGRSLGRIGEVTTVTISSENLSEFWQAPDAPPIPSASGTARP